MSQQFVIGIDLGTTNSVLAYAPLVGERANVELLALPQLVAAGTVESQTLLPSFLYLGQAQEAAGAAFDLPWAKGRDFAVGAWARRQAADVPERTVGAAKSWLGHSQVDRRQAILPWQAPSDVPKVSPVTASRRYLEHMIAAWNSVHPEAPFAEQQVVLTVPASFDASARELTREAALAAGFPEAFVLIEEPQAAVYAWLTDQGDAWRKALRVGETLLVCDVGGGTTDLTLVTAAEEQGELVLKRLAVGNHLLVGGDNMDLALAHYVVQLLGEKGTQLDPWQTVSLWHSCRNAKEMLLSAGGPEKHTLSILARGSRLLKGSLTVELAAQQVAEQLVDGFFPHSPITEKPTRRRASGFRELGLPFENDVGVTRHLAQFLSVQGGEQGAVRPTHVLFNGGVFKADALQQRLLDVLGSWFPSAPPQLLAGRHDLDHAVARGAAAYGFTKLRGGVRIRGGAARSYYVGIETAGLAVPGAPRPLRALCVMPRGMEEGTQADVPSGEIGLVVGEPAHFRFFSSATRKDDKPGDVLSRWTDEELTETDSLEANLPPDPAIADPFVPVKFQSHLTELGMFELWCQSANSGQRWKLEFSVREDGN